MTIADPGTPTFLRAHNDRTALRLLLEHGPLSRSRLGELSGMSKPTASQMILRLERAGLIEKVGETAGSRGPNAVLYGVRRDVVTGVAVSILGDEIAAVVVDALGTEHPVAHIAVAGEQRSPERDVDRALDAACTAAGIARDTVSMIAIGVQAAVDAKRDELSFTDTLPGWPQTGAHALISGSTGLSVVLGNDVNLAAIAERAFGAAQDEPSFVYFWIGEGLGLGIDVDGIVQRGAGGGAGEIGYLPVPPAALELVPGARDLTDLLGAAAVVALLGGAPGADLRDVLAATPLTDDHVAALAERIVLALTPVLALLDPAAIVLGGPTGIAGGDALAAVVQQRLAVIDDARSSVRPASAHTAVRMSSTGPEPVLRGAGRLLVDHIRARLEDGILPA
ncbi:ROK family protein [Microbacterium sp. W1N]|uniref:ROK family transcriptional regulator n=1 Tax=Microbacterium festucae TaxID=2977531 RepID=UPI0021C24ACC|nr:ROK family transcriptional regulator [Microbacterium festucae]MCT9819278.1 ROK family protein [Microbacterium festucae]